MSRDEFPHVLKNAFDLMARAVTRGVRMTKPGQSHIGKEEA